MNSEHLAMTSVTEQIAGIAQDLLTKRGITAPLDLDQDLAEAGLTSVDMVNLMLAIEAAFDIEIPAAQLKPENFRTVLAVEALVASVGGA